ncbi:GNAT family N-acetyltransferase [Saccharothrix australiensis]|uniref:Ribosomal protein S18 acetylase RimI-like enzyme n=1 Tax=Saccharothrix australiensis TaxID=2072 RepID=A0A495W3H6_9PSEU|nr:GNAT family N-acetyltransferase [Saccharothrix australiensis]RKT56271.1 ribosomal protein S18 acetylase RimI-like enzyme [Saccharothrix australiensis]
MQIRPALPAEFPTLQAIEVASGEPFRAHGMPDIADDDPMPLDVLRGLHVWVAADPEPVAWIAAEPVDGYAHVEQVSVHPDHARRGIGAALLDHVQDWAAARGLRGLTLTTFRAIPWNAPYYERLGFREVAEPTPGLAAIVAAEAARGLDPAERVCLRRSPQQGV